MKLGLGEKKAQKRDSHLKTATKREPYKAENSKTTICLTTRILPLLTSSTQSAYWVP